VIFRFLQGFLHFHRKNSASSELFPAFTSFFLEKVGIFQLDKGSCFFHAGTAEDETNPQ